MGLTAIGDPGACCCGADEDLPVFGKPACDGCSDMCLSISVMSEPDDRSNLSSSGDAVMKRSCRNNRHKVSGKVG